MAAAEQPLVPELPPVAHLAPGNVSPLAAVVLESAAGDPPVAAVTGESFEAAFPPFTSRGSHLITAPLWFRRRVQLAASIGA
jgi:hypothetical protein